MPQWDPEVAVDEALAQRLLADQFPALASLPVRLLGAGWDNTVFTVGGEWIFRFPRRETVLSGIENEIRFLPELARLLPVPVPVPAHIGTPSDAFPWPFFGARILPGVELCESPETPRRRLAPQLAAFLRTLHSRDVLEAIGPELSENSTRRAEMRIRVPVIREKLETLAGLWRAPDELDALLEEALALAPPRPRAVCHGDLHFRHVLVDGDRVTGLIDWIDLCRGEPALDLQLVWSALPPEHRESFFAEYGACDQDTVVRARVLAVFLSLLLLEYAHHEGLQTIEREALASLDRAVLA